MSTMQYNAITFNFIQGLQEVGIYRVSGVSSDVKRLKEKFDESELRVNWPVGCLALPCYLLFVIYSCA